MARLKTDKNGRPTFPRNSTALIRAITELKHKRLANALSPELNLSDEIAAIETKLKDELKDRARQLCEHYGLKDNLESLALALAIDFVPNFSLRPEDQKKLGGKPIKWPIARQFELVQEVESAMNEHGFKRAKQAVGWLIATSPGVWAKKPKNGLEQQKIEESLCKRLSEAQETVRMFKEAISKNMPNPETLRAGIRKS